MSVQSCLVESLIGSRKADSEGVHRRIQTYGDRVGRASDWCADKVLGSELC